MDMNNANTNKPWSKKDIETLSPYCAGAPSSAAALSFAIPQLAQLVAIWQDYEASNIDTAAHYRTLGDDSMAKRFDGFAKEKSKRWKWFERLRTKVEAQGLPDELKPEHERTTPNVTQL